jgi:hypothetical protein
MRYPAAPLGTLPNRVRDACGQRWWSRIDRGTVTGVDGLSDPLARRTNALLREAVLAHVRAERRRVHPEVLHVGVPGGPVAALPLDAVEPSDPGLRADVVAALRVRADRDGPADPAESLVWLTRAGGLELQDVDVRWLTAARAAYDEAGAPLSFVVVTRHGWRDPRSGLSRTWVRLRPDRGPTSRKD